MIRVGVATIGVALAACGAPRWTPAETRQVDRAVRVGLEELRDFTGKAPARIADLGADAVECLLNTAYGAANEDLRARARRYARENLVVLLEPWLARTTASVRAEEFGEVVTLAIYAHQLLAPADPRIAQMIDRSNAAARACGSLEVALGMDPVEILEDPEASNESVYELVLWSITFTDAQCVEGLELPPRAKRLLPHLWRYLETYPLPDASQFPEAANDTVFYDTAYLATHIGYIPTGYGRHRLRVEDAPWLLRFIRTNFEAVLEMGELDLVAEFVDLLLQMGFGADDPQIRTGRRYLLDLFDKAGGSWMAHRESYEEDEVSDYDMIHKAWTGISGVRDRIAEPCVPGSYGAVFRAALRDSRRDG